jgi:hypothetical protein
MNEPAVYKVIPYNKAQRCSAPALYFEIHNPKEKDKLEQTARSASGLGRFEGWDFTMNIKVKGARVAKSRNSVSE